MGVHGLTSWISKRSTLGTTVTCEGLPTEQVPLCVDGLAFLWHTALADSLRGGNYREYRLLLGVYVSYWRSVGLEPIFVFDGPFEASKLATVLQRSQQRLDRSIAYFRRPDEERSKHWVQRKAERLPVLLLSSVISELKSLRVVTHFAEAEADACVAEMAERLSGYATSNDSDYYIFSACGKGYVPLTTFEYGSDQQPYLSIRKSLAAPSVRFKTFTPAATARLLNIPPTFLPLFAALIGNDQSDYYQLFSLPTSRPRFAGDMDPARLERIARKLATFAHLPANTPAEVEAILRLTVESLVKGGRIVDPDMLPTLVCSALSYELTKVEAPSSTFPLHPTPSDTPDQAAARSFYLMAFRSGRLGSFTLLFLKHGLVDPPTALDNPDLPSPSAVFGAPIRQLIYAMLGHELHLPRTAITEHNRRQDQLVVSSVAIPPLAALLLDPTRPIPPGPIWRLTTENRISLYLALLRAPPRLLPPPPSILHHLPLVLALLHIQRITTRPWSRLALLSAIVTSILLTLPTLPRLPPPSHPPKRAFVQLSAELVSTLFHTTILAEVLGLTEALRPAYDVFEGNVYHGLLELGEGVEDVMVGLPEPLGAVAREVIGLFV